jgi:hypothetical protein
VVAWLRWERNDKLNLGDKKMKDKKICCICQRSAQILVNNNSERTLPAYWACKQCHKYFLQDKYIDTYMAIKKAHDLSSEANISTIYAINVVLNKYTLKEAKRKNRLKKMEAEGRSVDMFDIGSRVDGSFGIKQK